MVCQQRNCKKSAQWLIALWAPSPEGGPPHQIRLTAPVVCDSHKESTSLSNVFDGRGFSLVWNKAHMQSGGKLPPRRVWQIQFVSCLEAALTR